MTKLEELLRQQKKIEEEILLEKKKDKPIAPIENTVVENKYLIMGFWEFAIISTLMAVFFPWSLLYCVVSYGLQETKFIVIALFHDLLKTVFAILSILIPIIGLVLYLIFKDKL
jgi:hypothetical protein